MYQFGFLKKHSHKSLPASFFKGRRAFLNAFDKQFPPLKRGMKGDVTAFPKTKALLKDENLDFQGCARTKQL
jgi:hypothetical protein